MVSYHDYFKIPFNKDQFLYAFLVKVASEKTFSKCNFFKMSKKKKSITARETKDTNNSSRNGKEFILKDKVRFCHCNVSAEMQKRFIESQTHT